MNKNYGLYQTLISPDIKNSGKKKDITVEQKKFLSQKLSNLDKEQSEAVLMLIIEHARLNDEYDVHSDTMPYGLEQTSNDITFEIGKLPVPVKLILWKFCNVINKEG